VSGEATAVYDSAREREETDSAQQQLGKRRRGFIEMGALELRLPT